MPTTYTTLLGLALPATGELSGTWGDTVNSYITQYVDAAVAGAQIISGSQTAVTLSTTNGSALSQAGAGATGSAQYAIIRCTGNPASLLTITAPAANKVYLVINATSTSQSVKVVGTGPTTGVTVAASRAALIAWNGSDFVLIATTDIAQMSGFGTGVATALGQNVTGSGGIVLATSPTLVTPTLGAASATSVALAAGAAGTPSLTATGDLDTGFWFPAANTLAASTGGTERLRIDSTGKVGIGTTSPTYALDVQTSTVVTQARFAASATGGATILSGGGSQGIWCGGCDYNGTAFVARATTSSQMRTDGGLITFYTDSSLTSGNTFTPSERMRITEGGNVGIGTTSPSTRLQVNGTSSQAPATLISSAQTGTTVRSNSVFRIQSEATGRDVYMQFSDNVTNATEIGMISGAQYFCTSGSERARITTAGELLIGTTTVNSRLTVEGSGYFNQTSAGDGLTVRVNSGGTGQGGQIKMTNTYAGVPNPSKSMRVEDSGEWQIVNNAYNAVIMRVTDAGAAFKGDNTTTWSTTSDIRIKTNVRQINSALDKMLALKPCHFEYKNAIGKTVTGFIAQEFEQVFPGHVQEFPPTMQFQEYVDEQNPKLKAIDPNIVPYLVAAMQEQQAIIKSLTDRIAALEAKGA